MSSPYKRLSAKQDNLYTGRNMTTYVRGRLYKIYKFEIADNQHNPGSKTLVVYTMDGRLRFCTFLPSDFANPVQADDEMNKDIAENRAPSLCFYGVSGKKYVVQIHQYGEDIDHEKLKAVKSIQASTSPEKRKANDNETPKNKPRIEDKE